MAEKCFAFPNRETGLVNAILELIPRKAQLRRNMKPFQPSRLPGLLRSAFLLTALVLTVACWAEEPNWLVRNWQVEDGLPDNNITAIQQTSEGYLWLGTFNGLVRFDGVQFKTYYSANTPELRSSHILSLLAETDGTLWVGTEGGGLVRMTGGHFESISLPMIGPSDTIPALFHDRDGALWLSISEKGVARLQNGKAQLFADTNEWSGGSAAKLTTDPAVRTWLAARNNLLTFRSGAWFSRPSQVPPGKTDVIAIQRSRNGSVWLALPRQLAKLAAQGGIIPESTRLWGTEFSSALVTTLTEGEDGGLWVGTLNNGLFFSSAKSGEFQPVIREGQLSQNVITSVYEDQVGVIWVGTFRGGLFRIKRPEVSTLFPPGAGEVNIQTTFAARDGSVWIGTGGAGLYQYADGKFVRYGEAEGLSSLHICSVFEDRKTNLWVGTWGGLFRLEHNRFARITAANNLPDRVLALYEDRAGDLWVGTFGALARKHGETWTMYTLRDGLSNPDVRAITEDQKGNLWIGTAGGGLDCLANGHFTHFGAEQGLPQLMIISLLADEDGTLWIGSIGGGLVRYANGKFTAYTKLDGLADNTIGGIIKDEFGNLWLSSQNGILRVDINSLNAYAGSPSPALQCLSISVGDGLATPMCSGSGQPVVARTADDRLWVPNMKAVAVVDPHAAEVHTRPFVVKIEEVSIDGQDYVPSGDFPLHLSVGSKRFEFQYTALGLSTPEAARFRYKLEGLDTDWSDAGVKRFAVYSHLSPGTYRFRVTAASGDGIWHEAAVPMALQIVPHWWETWWFRTGLGTTVIALISLVIRTAERRRLHAEMEQMKRQQAISEERARIARDIHDDMGSRLTAISLLGALAMRESSPIQAVREDVSRMMQKTHELVGTLDEIVWAINPRNDSLGHLATYLCAHAKEFLEPTSIACRLDVAPNLPSQKLTSEVRHNVFLATQEALNNVVKHSQATKLWLKMGVENRSFVLEIADDGKGFSSGSTDETGDGVRNMAQRMADCGGTSEICSHPGQGTTVCFRLPLPQMGDVVKIRK
jgi:signal transduction histidine kinase/ligand-binding sensor domain-containing protein